MLGPFSGSTIEELKSRLTHREFLQWWWRWQRTPWGPKAEDVRHVRDLANKFKNPETFKQDKTKVEVNKIKELMLEEDLKPWETLDKDENAVMMSGWLMMLKSKYNG